MDPERYDLVIRGDLIWPGPGSEPLAGAALGIRGGRIAALGPESRVSTSGAEILGGPGRLVMPGLVNGHVHLPMVLFRGLADDLDLMDWLENHIWPAEAAAVDQESVYWGSLLALAEMIRSGTTCLAEAYFCAEGIRRAVVEAGVRAVVAQGNIDFPAPGIPDPAQGLAVAREFLESGAGVEAETTGLVRSALFCHAPYTCSPERIRAVKELCREHGSLCFIHLAETQAETGIIMERHGKRPTGFLDGLGFWDDQAVAVHGVHLEQGEMETLARRGAALITCPESNMKLASGRARVGDWLAAGVRVGLGTDGAASNNDLNMFGEMGSLARIHKGATGDPTAMDAETVLEAATRGGARALGYHDLGRLEIGARADVITLDLDQPHLMPLHRIPAQLVYAAHGGEVCDSVVGGRVLMKNGRLTIIDLERVRAEVGRIFRRIRG